MVLEYLLCKITAILQAISDMMMTLKLSACYNDDLFIKTYVH